MKVVAAHMKNKPNDLGFSPSIDVNKDRNCYNEIWSEMVPHISPFRASYEMPIMCRDLY